MSQVSAFFSVGWDGTAHQYLPVGKGFVAWAEKAGNPYWYSCETEDDLDSSIPMTHAQLTVFAQILEACSARDGFPLQITDDVNGTGLITHGDGGEAWSHPDCPGKVVNVPAGITLYHPKADGSIVADTSPGDHTLQALSGGWQCQCSGIVRATAEHSPGGLFSSDMASYLNGVFSRSTTHLPSGVQIYYQQ